MISYERIYNLVKEEQNKTDSRFFPGHANRMKGHETRIQRELQKPENKDDQARSEEEKDAMREKARKREAAKRTKLGEARLLDLIEELSMKARRALAGHRLIKKRPKGPLRNQMIIRARELKDEVPTSPKRDVVRAAMKAQVGESRKAPKGREESRMHGKAARKNYALHNKLFSKAISMRGEQAPYAQRMADELRSQAKSQFDRGIRKTVAGSRAVKGR